MKKRNQDEDFELQEMDKAKILVSVIPVVLIILILCVTLIVDKNKKDKTGAEDVQQSMMDYADETMPADSGQVSAGEEADATPKREDAEEHKEDGAKEEAERKEDSTPSPTPSQQAMDVEKVDYSKVSYDKDEQLKEMMSYWADNNQKALDDLANLDRFKAMSWALKNTRDCYYYGDKNAAGLPEGKGIAVYADNQYYYGDWKNGVRSGKGTWIHYHIRNTSANKNDVCLYHQYTGSWAEDLPDGEGSEHYDYDTALLKENAYYYTNLIGSYSKGLVHGEFYLTNIYANGDFKEWNGDADHGSWIYRSENKDTAGRRTVNVSTSDPDNYIWMYPKENKDIGVPCLISTKK